MAFDTGEPFGLPRGTVRGIIALAFTATLIQQTVVGALDIVVFVGLAGGAIGSYFSSRAAEATPAPAPEKVDPPATAETVERPA